MVVFAFLLKQIFYSTQNEMKQNMLADSQEKNNCRLHLCFSLGSLYICLHANSFACLFCTHLCACLYVCPSTQLSYSVYTWFPQRLSSVPVYLLQRHDILQKIFIKILKIKIFLPLYLNWRKPIIIFVGNETKPVGWHARRKLNVPNISVFSV
jgi:hypothetical protein